MRILLIGNFAPPYEDENLHNISILKRLKEEGNECSVINISGHPSKEKEFVNSKSYIDFVFKVIRHAWGKDVVHFFTKGYTRLGLLQLMTSIFVGRFFRARAIVSLHSEFFSVIGQMRSKVGGQQTVYLSFSFAHKIIFGDKDTYDVASRYKRKHNFELMPLFINRDKELKENETPALRKLKDKKKIILFSNVQYPSLLFDILSSLLSHTHVNDIGIVISVSETPSTKLQHLLEEDGHDISGNMVFIGYDDMKLLSKAYGISDLIVRPMSCDGEIFFQDFAVYVRRTERSENYVYFLSSLVFVKEGETADLCACIISDILSKEPDAPHTLQSEDFYAKVRKMYDKPLKTT